ncbi:MAG TPA: sugar ABC transporter permease [Symbiobacteriaceae bacterium]|jgi:ABC-type sugar transport system permease subunit
MKLGATLGRGLNMPVGSTKFAWRKFWADSALAYLFLLPTLAVLATFSFYPVVRAFTLSLYDWGLSPDKEFIGFQNYVEVFHDKVFWLAVRNTAVYIIGTVPVQIILALGVALLLNQKIRFRPFYRLAFFVPYITTATAISMVWLWIYHDQWGLLNYILGWFGADPKKWLLDPRYTMMTIIVIGIWKIIGYTVVIFLAGLQNVDRELYNAARVDGANDWQGFWHVTWPLLSPTTFFVSITSMIGAFKVFTEIFVLYGGKPGPLRAGTTMVFYVYEAAFQDHRMGYASAAAYILFFMVLFVTFFQLWYAKKHVHYDA